MRLMLSLSFNIHSEVSLYMNHQEVLQLSSLLSKKYICKASFGEVISLMISKVIENLMKGSTILDAIKNIYRFMVRGQNISTIGILMKLIQTLMDDVLEVDQFI